jgi:phospholipid/cholesterol/gamma-HCH transport system substrate-binding protein
MKRRDEVLVGILMTVSAILLVVGIIWLSRGGLTRGYPLYAVFEWGAGLKQGSPVLLSGVNVGYVDDVRLDLDHGTIIVMMRVNDEHVVPEGTTATIEPNGIFGDMLIALRPHQPQKVFFAAGDTVPSGDPAPTMGDVIAQVDSIGRTLGDVTEAFELQLVQEGGIASLRRSLEGLDQLVTQLNTVAAEQSRQLTATMGSFRNALSAFDSTMIDSTVRNLRTTSSNLAMLTSDFQRTSDQIQTILGKLEGGDGTAAQLLNDPTIANNLKMATLRLDSLVADIKANPRKYLPRFSIFGGGS